MVRESRICWDLFADNIRSPFFAIVYIVCIVSCLIFLVFFPALYTSRPPFVERANLALVIAPQKAVEIHVRPTVLPIVRLTSQSGLGVSDEAVAMRVVSIQTPDYVIDCYAQSTPVCNAFNGSNVLVAHTDDTGTAVFRNFFISSGPVGVMEFVFEVLDLGIGAHGFARAWTNTVARLSLPKVVSFAPQTLSLGEAFNVTIEATGSIPTIGSNVTLACLSPRIFKPYNSSWFGSVAAIDETCSISGASALLINGSAFFSNVILSSASNRFPHLVAIADSGIVAVAPLGRLSIVSASFSAPWEPVDGIVTILEGLPLTLSLPDGFQARIEAFNGVPILGSNRFLAGIPEPWIQPNSLKVLEALSSGRLRFSTFGPAGLYSVGLWAQGQPVPSSTIVFNVTSAVHSLVVQVIPSLQTGHFRGSFTTNVPGKQLTLDGCTLEDGSPTPCQATSTRADAEGFGVLDGWFVPSNGTIGSVTFSWRVESVAFETTMAYTVNPAIKCVYVWPITQEPGGFGPIVLEDSTPLVFSFGFWNGLSSSINVTLSVPQAFGGEEKAILYVSSFQVLESGTGFFTLNLTITSAPLCIISPNIVVLNGQDMACYNLPIAPPVVVVPSVEAVILEEMNNPSQNVYELRFASNPANASLQLVMAAAPIVPGAVSTSRFQIESLTLSQKFRVTLFAPGTFGVFAVSDTFGVQSDIIVLEGTGFPDNLRLVQAPSNGLDETLPISLFPVPIIQFTSSGAFSLVFSAYACEAVNDPALALVARSDAQSVDDFLGSVSEGNTVAFSKFEMSMAPSGNASSVSACFAYRFVDFAPLHVSSGDLMMQPWRFQTRGGIASSGARFSAANVSLAVEQAAFVALHMLPNTPIPARLNVSAGVRSFVFAIEPERQMGSPAFIWAIGVPTGAFYNVANITFSSDLYGGDFYNIRVGDVSQQLGFATISYAPQELTFEEFPSETLPNVINYGASRVTVSTQSSGVPAVNGRVDFGLQNFISASDVWIYPEGGVTQYGGLLSCFFLVRQAHETQPNHIRATFGYDPVLGQHVQESPRLTLFQVVGKVDLVVAPVGLFNSSGLFFSKIVQSALVAQKAIAVASLQQPLLQIDDTFGRALTNARVVPLLSARGAEMDFDRSILSNISGFFGFSQLHFTNGHGNLTIQYAVNGRVFSFENSSVNVLNPSQSNSIQNFDIATLFLCAVILFLALVPGVMVNSLVVKSWAWIICWILSILLHVALLVCVVLLFQRWPYAKEAIFTVGWALLFVSVSLPILGLMWILVLEIIRHSKPDWMTRFSHLDWSNRSRLLNWSEKHVGKLFLKPDVDVLAKLDSELAAIEVRKRILNGKRHR